MRERFGNLVLIFIVCMRNLAQFNWDMGRHWMVCVFNWDMGRHWMVCVQLGHG